MNVKELVTYLASRNGLGMAELKQLVTDESELKRIIQSGLDLGSIIKEGEKRGTKYFAAEGRQESSSEIIEDDLDKHGMNEYLASKKPIPGIGYFCFEEKINPEMTKNPNVFKTIQGGKRLKMINIIHDKDLMRNVICDENIEETYNSFGIFRDGNTFYVLVIRGTEQERIEFPDYEELREWLRAECVI